MILFKNPRDKLQIKTLAHQIFPTQNFFFLKSFDGAVKEAHGYLVLDLTPSCPKRYRVRSGLLPHEYEAVYLPKT